MIISAPVQLKFQHNLHHCHIYIKVTSQGCTVLFRRPLAGRDRAGSVDGVRGYGHVVRVGCRPVAPASTVSTLYRDIVLYNINYTYSKHADFQTVCLISNNVLI